MQTEQHQVDPNAHCANPKCGYYFSDAEWQEMMQAGYATCPRCGYSQQMTELFAPGGGTRSTLTLDEVGNLGEEVVARIAELPGIGHVVESYATKTNPIDAIVEGFNGVRYGVEIKTIDSRAQSRFKLGGQQERQAKIAYCYQQGLAPALVGVRLNFFDDTADVFFREGMTDTWIGTRAMKHVAQHSFADINPFRQPDDNVPVSRPEPASEAWTPVEGPAVYGGWRTAEIISDDDYVPSKQKPERDPDHIFVYYNGHLMIEEWHHNRRYADMVEELLKEKVNGGIGLTMHELDDTEVVAGDVYTFADGGLYIDQKSLAKPEAKAVALDAISRWWDDQRDNPEATPEGQGEPEGPETREEASGEASEGSGEAESDS